MSAQASQVCEMAQLELPPPAYTENALSIITYPPPSYDAQPSRSRNATGLREPRIVDLEANAVQYHTRRPAPAGNKAGCARVILILVAILGLVVVGMTVFCHHPGGA
ncbi:hypothetical protein LTR91_013426 [Friedmanniomyces endolithicus]|uniref:Uncharacterized protein n=1 Tax=Friedmanniomyces endolithicus TaxID=329885 RepID=A0AAN6KDW4_9PEZI|nr:hypothetical protein LTR59_002651 [Friedmanniomyces endolithicus]KAK0819741.1 hypothetical protein LTR38_000494 [Friedmanniomyces endolithicus]KAK0822020.1 hypothetical protein LTR75_000155 [Friedmanniomyces endolithicus]KAK0858220.1 hypothetical protein LTR03_000229 [Friedmanniomyces endolithicus]KAK0873343.1 hypothetical protein LTS02_000894 [Friedmanniomyces endolithicus]